MPGISGFKKHHIIPQQLVDHPVLKTSGLNIHASQNIIYLPKYEEGHPTRTIHRGSHPTYNAQVRNSLNEIELVGREQGLTKEQYRSAVKDVISENRQGLRRGEIKLNKNSIRGVC
ncbi:AHH domain-containing protein [Pseudomonas sp. WHRI 8519]|uniref:AHH domain-containing protein n=1 Tax=Pseudomonas sp. WHRI 8519 TaxID=3162567 RepID=UPI0032F0236F